MRRYGSFFVLSLCIIAAEGPRDLRSENVFLKDGRIIHGTIVTDATRSITVKEAGGKLNVIDRADILRILYTELSLGKIHVQMRDGRSFEAFIVDEEQSSYTFRKELLSPDEMKVERAEILFISERNPSGLKGTPDTTSVKLSWFPPYNPVKHYLVYHREKSEGDFRPAIKSRGKSLTLDNLKSNTSFVLYVTAIDPEGNESLPSNKLNISTLNIKPGRPEKLRYQMKRSKINDTGKGSTETAADFLSWNAVVDRDGVIKGYNIYHRRNGVEEKIGSVKGTEYEIPRDMSVYDIRIRAVDDSGDESPSSRIRHSRALKAGFQPVFFIPSGRLAEMFDPGYGALVNFSEKNFLMPDLELGVSMSAIKLPGKDTDKIKDMLLAPFTADAGYHIPLSEFFSVMPYLGAGYTFMDVNYISVFENKNKKSWEPFVRTGAMLNYEFEYLQVSGGADYGFIYETSGTKPFFELFIRAGLLVDL